MDIYGHLVPGGNRQAVEKLDEEIPGQAEVWKQEMETNEGETETGTVNYMESLARPEGFEPPTLRSEV